MKITGVDVVLVETPAYEPAFNWRHGLHGSAPADVGAWLVLRTDSDVVGLSFTNRGVILQDAVDRYLRTELVGQDPLAREFIWHRLWELDRMERYPVHLMAVIDTALWELDRMERYPVHLMAVIDTALWDIGGKAAGLPLHQLLGSYRSSIPAYASTVTFDSIEEYLDVADQCLELGFPAIKLHAWGDARMDAKLSLALREHVGPDIPLMYDGSAGFDLLDATYVGQALSEAGYLWYEEPMKEFSITAYKRLGERVDVPLMVCEVAEGAHMTTADFIDSGCAGVVRAGPGLRGGITGAMRTAHLADAYLLRAEIHGGGLAARHLCMAISNTTYYEALVDSPQVLRPAEVDASGKVTATTTPGIGWESEWAEAGVPAELAKINAINISA